MVRGQITILAVGTEGVMVMVLRGLGVVQAEEQQILEKGVTL